MSDEILIVDDEDDIRNLVKGILEDEGYKIREANGAKSAYAAIEERLPGLIILDIWLEGSHHDGIEILAEVKKQHPHIPVVMISGHGSIETAVSAIKEGAYDFIEKPFKSDRLLLMIRRALEAAALRRENESLKLLRSETSRDLIGNSPAIEKIREIIERVAPTNSRVLLAGEPGTGKDVAAQLIHAKSSRAGKPFIALNCAALSPERLEASLFGSVNNGEAQESVLEQAHEGTLLLDEISDMPLETQGKVIRVLQEERFQKLGDSKFTDIDVRILASTNTNLEEAIERGDFRQDLYYRLNVVPIDMPLLKNRLQDIPELIEHLSQSIMKQTGLPSATFGAEAVSVMKRHSWPGNVRQLRNVIEWVLIMNGNNGGKAITPEQLPPEITGHSASSVTAEGGDIGGMLMEHPLRDAREMFEKTYLQSQIDRFDGNISQTAKFVGMERSALHRKLKSLGIMGADNKDSDSDNMDNKKLKRA